MTDLKNRLKENTIGALVSELMHSRNQAHVFHWQTKSYAKHIALGGYYDEIIGLIDGLVEAYQGKQGIIKDFKVPKNSFLMTTDDVIISYFSQLLILVEGSRSIFTDSDLLNQLDNIITLVKTTLYKLKNLS